METNHCPTCHAPIPVNAPGGFCPACLLRDAEETPSHGPAGPPLEDIAAAFPNLEGIELIGQGGMGFVYKVRQPSLDRIVALKILSPELGRDPAFAERFAREARTLGKLHHPNIVTVFEHGESGGFFYLLMEYVDGLNLRQALRAGRFTPKQALSIVPGICDALQYAHENGVWHRDIKPENILLDRDGKVKIADFGIARIVGDPRRDFTLTMTGNALGSAAYMAPEQHEKPHEADHRADIYSLGVVIYEMLTGELPLGRFPSPSQKAAVNARIDEIVLRTLEKERELRQQSATEVKTDFLRAMPPGGAPPSPVAVTRNKAGGSSVMAKLALALMLATAFGFVFLLIFEVKFIINLMFCAATLALCFILAILSWRTSLGKSMAIISALILLLGGGRLAIWKLDDMSTGRRSSSLSGVLTPWDFFGVDAGFFRGSSD
jgi:tRNA A-37 threonylcarbamoyl transferase component Bud32